MADVGTNRVYRVQIGIGNSAIEVRALGQVWMRAGGIESSQASGIEVFFLEDDFKLRTRTLYAVN